MEKVKKCILNVFRCICDYFKINFITSLKAFAKSIDD